MYLRTHSITLHGPRLTLRPLREDDWPVLLRWNSDPQILYYTEGDDVTAYDLPQIQAIYRSISQNAYCFMAELAGKPIGECWLQRMNLPRILAEFPEHDCRRIDLMIGEKERWGQGFGTEIIRILTHFGFAQEDAGLIFGCDIADYNPASRRAFEKAGYTLHATIPQPKGDKARLRYDMLAST